MKSMLSAIVVMLVLTGGCNDGVIGFTTAPPEDTDEEVEEEKVETIITDVDNPTGGGNEPIIDNINEPENPIVSISSVPLKANPTTDSVVRVEFQSTTADTIVEMNSDVVQYTETFKQTIRPTHTAQYEQTGTAGKSVEDNFQQNEKGVLDILIVVDNSGSMEEVQHQLSTKLSSLLNYVADSNWQIAITSTDRRDCIKQRINELVPNYEMVFSDTIIGLGTTGSRHEEAILKAEWGLKGKCGTVLQSNWLRAEASLAIIIITDEDHQCYDYVRHKSGKDFSYKYCYNSSDSHNRKLEAVYSNIDQFYSYLRSIREPKTTARIYGILSDKPSETDGHVFEGSRLFKSWREKVNGERTGNQLFDRIASIYSEDYGEILQSISEDMSIYLKDQFVLSRKPDTGTVKVRITDGFTSTLLNPDEYLVVNKTLTLKTPPPKGAMIDVDYAYDTSPFIKTFGLPHVPIPDSIEVKITVDGQQTVVPPSDYYLSSTQELTFHITPPENSMIDITYTEDVPLMTSFQIGEGEITELEIKVNEIVIHEQEFDFDTSSNTIVFHTDAVPNDGDTIEVKYTADLGDVLEYPLSLHPDILSVEDITCLAKEDRSVTVACSHSTQDGADIITFPADEFTDGRVIIVRQALDIHTNDITLQAHYQPDSLELRVGKDVCKFADLEIVDNEDFTGTIILSNPEALTECPALLEDVEDIEVSYRYMQIAQTFSIEESHFTKYQYEYEHWAVFVNGERIPPEDFTVIDHTVSFGYFLPPDSVVEIIVSLY